MIDLLVVNYNTPHLLERLLDTLHSDYEPGVWNLYLQDNGSTDDSADIINGWVKEHKYKFGYVKYGDNVGYSAAINSMASISKSEFLCAVNADTWFTTNHVKEVEETFHFIPSAGIIGVKQMDEDSIIRHGGIFWDGIANPIHRGWNKPDPNDEYFKVNQPCWTVSGSIYYVRRSTWDHLSNYEPYRQLYPDHTGAFLPTPHFFEETFCSQLAHHLGYDVVYAGEVETAGHTWHASSKVGDASRMYFERSRQMYKNACDALGIHHECN